MSDMQAQSVVLYGVGSPIVVDFEESLRRAGLRVTAGIQNIAGESWMEQAHLVRQSAELTPAVLSVPFLVPLFGPANRQRAAREAASIGFTEVFTLVDPSSATPHNWSIAAGTYVNGGCAVGAACEFGDFVLINRGACIGHHVRLERFVSVGPGSVLGGFVHVGRGTLIGAGSVVLPEVRIGQNAVIGAGSVVTKDIPDHSLAVGSPARIVKTDIPGYKDQSVE